MARNYHSNDYIDPRSGIDAGGEAETAAENIAARRRGSRKKICRFCAGHDTYIDYKDSNTLRLFLTERGKVVPRRISGNCSKHQRMLTVAIKRGRMIALLPFTTTST
jgi:small subunit ribosomal protein S18